MKLISWSSSFKQKVMVSTGALLLALSLGLVGTATQRVHAADCDNNAIMKCGTGSAADFIRKVSANNDGYGHRDLKFIYEAYDLAPTDYTKLVASARPGLAYKDGRIVVDGQTVATGTKSIGRLASFQGSGYFTKSIHGVNYYGNINSKAFKTGPLPVMVMFDAHGSMQFAVLTSCGNPISGSVVRSSYTCNSLSKTAVSGQQNTYRFTGNASATNNARIVKYTFNFGDGSRPQVVSTSAKSATVMHHYTQAGNFKATVTVTVSLPGKQSVQVTSVPCTKTVNVSAPFYSCIQLTGAILDQNQFKYSFKANASFGNGAKFTGADFKYGDGKTDRNIRPVGTAVSTTHQYAQAGNYEITATLHFSVDGAVKSASCTARVTPTQPPTPECKPGVPQGSPLCAETPPVTLVNTGPGGTIAIFGVVVVAGFFLFRQFMYRKNRAVAADTTAFALGQHMVAGAAKDDQSDDMVAHLSNAQHHHPRSGTHHPNAAASLHHPRYHRSNRFRPGKHE